MDALPRELCTDKHFYVAEVNTRPRIIYGTTLVLFDTVDLDVIKSYG